jgi:hypothetical protein
MDLKEIWNGILDWIKLAQNIVQQRDLVSINFCGIS